MKEILSVLLCFACVVITHGLCPTSLHTIETIHSSLSESHVAPFSFLLSRSWYEVLEPNSITKFDYDTVEESFQEVVADEALNLFDILRQATTTKDTNTAIALAISDFVSGYSSGLVSRASASLLGDTKKDKSVTKASSTAAFFGIRGLIRGAGLTLGIPRPIVLVLASALASIASERTKIDSRERENRSSKDKGGDEEDEESEKLLSKPELTGDISKWITFDTLLESLPTEMIDSGLRKNLLYFAIGSFSSTVGLGVNKFTAAQERPRVKKGVRTKDTEQVKEELIKICSSSFEGGVLFFSYSYLSYLIAQVLPSDLKNELLFSKYLDSVESGLQDIVIQKKMDVVPNPFAPLRFR